MLTLFRQDSKGQYVPVTTNLVNRFERVKVVMIGGADWGSRVKFFLKSTGYDSQFKLLGTDKIYLPGTNRETKIEFEVPSTPGMYIVSAQWIETHGWAWPKIRERSTSLTFNVTDEVGTPRAVTKKDSSIGSTIQGSLKAGGILVWGILALVIVREIQKMK